MFGFSKLTFGRTRQILAAAALSITVFSPAIAPAQALDDGSKARVNLSSKLAMLSKTISSAACRMSSGIGTDEARLQLRDARIEVQTILDGLEFGNRALGIPTPEKRSRTLRALRVVADDWQRMDGAIDGMLAGSGLEDNAARIYTVSNAMFDNSEILASEIQAYYSNPNELLFVDAIAIQMAGRQRTLNQLIAAESCKIHTGATDPEALVGAIGLFEKTLVALRDGLPAVGVRKPPNDQVLTKIEKAWTDWQDEKASLVGFAQGNTIEAAAVSRVAETSELLRKDMDDLVILYILSTPGRDGAIRGLLTEMAGTELITWVQDPALVEAVKAQNAAHANLGQDEVDALDVQWRAEAGGDGGPLVADLMSRAVSLTLRDKQVATAGFINEIFVMDNLGLNVAQSAVTSDYWQGDEAKWQETFGNGSGAVHISDVEFDDSTGVFQSQVSLPVKDLETGDLIGAITFGVNVQSLL
ncbi:MAG: type IV pili methyl-accepting chemotaxis transducer N-terminal domain-containing protein [Pseudomonadota bacterium]